VFNVGGGEILVILVVALIVLGPTQLPKAARQVGQAMTELKRISSGFQQELTHALDTEAEKPQSPGGPAERTEPAAGDGESTS
jgi:sec-independent protein translocase protein TatB